MSNRYDDLSGKVYTRTFDSSKNIRITYENENEFRKLENALKTYNMLAYKDYIFDLLQKLKQGKTIGDEIEENLFKVHLQSSEIVEFVHGESYFTYRIEDDNKAVLLGMEPRRFLIAGHQKELPAYKGVPIAGPKDRFKVDLYLTLHEEKKG